MAEFVSEVLDLSRLKRRHLNLLESGCGTGKTYSIVAGLLKQFPDLKPDEIIFATSRSVAAMQQAVHGDFIRFMSDDPEVVEFWSGNRSYDSLSTHGVRVMTYNRVAWLWTTNVAAKPESWMENVKVLILDEAHCLFSDLFMRDVFRVDIIMGFLINRGDLVIGMTATPDILLEGLAKLHIPVNHLLDEPVFRYKAKQLICSDFRSIPNVLKKYGAPGKTMILCNSIAKCEILHNTIPNSAVLVSENNRKEFTPEMARIRAHIAKNFMLPDTVKDPVAFNSRGKPIEWVEHPLDCLIVTSCMREGYSLLPVSNVRNMVCCSPDSVHVIQFAGRARYNLDCLVVAPFSKASVSQKNKLLRAEQTEFDQFCSGRGTKWIEKIAPIVQDNNVLRVNFKSFMGNPNKKSQPIPDIDRFVQYVNENWLLTPQELEIPFSKRPKAICKLTAEPLLKMACDCNLNLRAPDKTTTRFLFGVLQNYLGYELQRHCCRVDGQTANCTFIISHDPSRVFTADEFTIRLRTQQGTA